MARIEESVEYGKIIYAIHNCQRTLTQIAESVGKSKPAIMEQLDKLKEAGYIKPEEEKEAGFSVRYILNKQKIVSYWAEKYGAEKFDVKEALASFDSNFTLLTFLWGKIPISLDMMGHFFSLREGLNKQTKQGNFLNLTIGDLVNSEITKQTPEAKKNMRIARKYMKRGQKIR